MINPHSSEAEQGILSSIMIAPDESIPECIRRLTPYHFYLPAHQTTYNLFTELWTDGIPIELLLFTEELTKRRLLDQVGGPAFVTHLAVFVPTAANLGYYIDIVHEKYILRQLLTVATKATHRAQFDQGEGAEVLSEAVEALGAITRTLAVRERQSVFELVQQKVNRMENGKTEEAIVKTGIEKLDKNSPLYPSDMPLITGERKAGKSMLAATITCNAARTGTPVAYFSLEDSVHKLVDRLLSGISRVAMIKQINATNLTESEMKASTDAALILSGLPLYLYDDLHDLDRIVAEARQIAVTKKVGLIIVDYAQLIRCFFKTSNREQEVAHISRTLRLLALEIKVPILLLSQLNEQGRSRESRALEQDATASWKIRMDSDEEETNKRWIDIEWQRNGESNIKFPVTFLGWCARIENFQE